MKGKIEKNTEYPPTSEKENFTFYDFEKLHENDLPSDKIDGSQKQSNESKGLPIGGILAWVLGIFSIAATYGWITGSWDAEFTIPTIIAVLIGGIVAFFTTKTFGYAFLAVETVGTVVLVFIETIIDIIQEGPVVSAILETLLFGWIVAIPLCVFPALVCTIIVTIIKMIIHVFKDEN